MYIKIITQQGFIHGLDCIYVWESCHLLVLVKPFVKLGEEPAKKFVHVHALSVPPIALGAPEYYYCY
jgi:hypothetical protein